MEAVEGAKELLASVEVELFGEKKVLEPSFELITTFEEMAGSSILNPGNWHPMPKLSLVALLLWAACGGRKTGKSVKDFYSQVNGVTTGAAVGLVIMIDRQYKAAEKKGDAAE